MNLSWTGFRTPSVYGDSGYFNGKVHEALVLLGTLSDAESKKLEGYLAWNNGLVDKLPSNHLYKLEPPLNFSVWDPTDLNLLRWYKADTLVLNDGDPVSSWADSSPNADPAIQATASKQPIYKDGVANGRPAVRFDSIDDVLNFSEILDTSAA